jgi:hypothetical protein
MAGRTRPPPPQSAKGSIILARQLDRIEDMKNACRILIDLPEGKRPFVTPRSRWEDNIKSDLKAVTCGLDSSDSG